MAKEQRFTQWKGYEYEIRKEFRGRQTLIIWNYPSGEREASYVEPEAVKENLTRGISEGYSNQRVYENIDENAIEAAVNQLFNAEENVETDNLPWQITDLSNKALDNLILQGEIK